MDVKHRKAYAKIDIVGIKQPIMLNVGVGLAQLLGKEILMALAKAENRYEGITIQIDFKEIQLKLTEFEKFQEDWRSQIDWSMVEQASEEDELLYAGGNPSDPKSPIYDPIYAEYISCHSSKHRETKTPIDLSVIRKHVEDKYRGTQWWNGAHKW